MLNIHLSNSLILWVSLKPKSNDPRFFHLQNAPEYIAPQTDGERVYWTGGASLTLEEIITMVRNGPNPTAASAD